MHLKFFGDKTVIIGTIKKVSHDPLAPTYSHNRVVLPFKLLTPRKVNIVKSPLKCDFNSVQQTQDLIDLKVLLRKYLPIVWMKFFGMSCINSLGGQFSALTSATPLSVVHVTWHLTVWVVFSLLSPCNKNEFIN